MFKQSLLILLAASILSIGAFAQDAPPNNQPSAQENDGHRGHMDPAQRTQELTRKLNLTTDQQTKVQQILQSASSQMETLRSDSSLSEQDRHSKMMSIHQTADTQIRALLDPNQQKQWDEMQAKRGQWGHHRGAPNSNSNDQQAPPPQQ